ncbi:MAG TPA: phage tail protein [Bacteroidales bacterium]|nr:phage tail protein [Bacteroidales bacterium]HRX97093.1 phage tail protein [Bacteroidales bacterium]
MAGDKQEAPWPVPKFHFSVQIGGSEISFQEVSGLDAETDLIEYRAGNSPQFSTVKMPGLKKTSNVTLKKGMFKDDSKIFDWYTQVKMNVIKRETVVIQLLDEDGNPVFTWKLANAFPINITGTDLKSDGNEVAIETLELAHEGLEIEQS